MPAGAGVELPCGRAGPRPGVGGTCSESVMRRPGGRFQRASPATHPAGGRGDAVDRAVPVGRETCSAMDRAEALGRETCSAADGRCAASAQRGHRGAGRGHVSEDRTASLSRMSLHSRAAPIVGPVASAAGLGALSRACEGWLTSVRPAMATLKPLAASQSRRPPRASARRARRQASGTSKAAPSKSGRHAAPFRHLNSGQLAAYLGPLLRRQPRKPPLQHVMSPARVMPPTEAHY
jgi:hypothetical protein